MSSLFYVFLESFAWFNVQKVYFIEQKENQYQMGITCLLIRRICLISFGRTFLPWWGIRAHKHRIKKSITLGILANEITPAIATQQKSLDSLAWVVLDNRMALDYILAEQGGICQVINSSCCIYSNSWAEVETHLDKIREQPLGRNKLLLKSQEQNGTGFLVCFPGFLEEFDQYSRH